MVWIYVHWEVFDYWLNSLLVTGLLKFSISLWLGLDTLYVLRNLSIFSRSFNLSTCDCSLSPLMIFCVSVVWVVTAYLSFLILFIWVLSFFSVSLPEDLSILFTFSKNELLVSLIFSVVFLISLKLFLLWSFFSSFH